MRLDPINRVIAVASFGEVDVEALHASLQTALEALERDFVRRPGAFEGLEVQRSADGTLLQRETCPTAPTLWKWRELPWFDVEPPSEIGSEASPPVEEWREQRRDAAICGSLLLLGFGLQQSGALAGGVAWVVPAIYALASFFGGRDAAIDAWAKLRKERGIDIHFLMLAVAIGAAFVGAWGEGALLLFLFSASGAMEGFVSHRTRREIDALLKASPRQATRLNADGSEEEVNAADLCEGDLVLVRPGSLFPADAEVTRGETAADESALTGESLPVDKSLGDPVYSGTLNTWGSVVAQVVRPAGESALQKIIDLIRNAQQRKAPAQRFTDRFGTGYTWGVLGLTVLMFFVWWLGFGITPFANGAEGYSAFYRSMALLVVMSPCALVLSIPSAILAAIAAGARKGVLFRGGAAVEQLAGVDLVALDKTGTLTSGELVVDEILSIPAGQEEEVAAIACSIERYASHPVARAIVRYGRKAGIPLREVEDFQTHTGLGVSARVGGDLCVLGRRSWIGRESSEGGLGDVVAQVPMAEAACIEVWVLRGNLLGRILLRDRVRQESSGVLSDLRALGIAPRMLTGDREGVAHQVGAEIGLRPEEIRAGLLPEGKVEAIQEYRRQGRTVAMVGDGINDAPSLAEADVAVAMGARGSDAALEQSDVVLMNDRIELFVEAYRLSRRARSVIRQNLVISFGTVLLMAIVALGGRVPLSLGVLAHEGSTVLVCLNSLRLLLSSGRARRQVKPAGEAAPVAAEI